VLTQCLRLKLEALDSIYHHVRNAETAGAIGVIVYNNETEESLKGTLFEIGAINVSFGSDWEESISLC